MIATVDDTPTVKMRWLVMSRHWKSQKVSPRTHASDGARCKKNRANVLWKIRRMAARVKDRNASMRGVTLPFMANQQPERVDQVFSQIEAWLGLNN